MMNKQGLKRNIGGLIEAQITDQEKIPARSAINAYVQPPIQSRDFLLLSGAYYS
jgi:hypothetical protein